MLLHILFPPDFILRWSVHLHSLEYHVPYSCTVGGKSEGMGQLGKVAWAGRVFLIENIGDPGNFRQVHAQISWLKSVAFAKNSLYFGKYEKYKKYTILHL